MTSRLLRAVTVLGAVVVAGVVMRADSTGTKTRAHPSVHAQQPAAAQAAGAPRRLAGAWQLVTRTVRRADGTVLADPVLGAQPLGRLFYDASGVMMLQMMRLQRTAAIGAPGAPQDAANPRVVLGYDAYFGTYTVDERAGTITHRVEGSLFPEDLGKDFVRGFTLDGDTLTLTFTSTTNGADITRTLVFRRSR